MANLKASINTAISKVASIKPNEIIKGSIKTFIVLKGSVSEFTRSLSIRAFIQPIVNIYSKINMIRVAKANVNSKVSVFAKIVGFKEAIANITTKTNVYINGRVFKNAKANINVNPIFGKRTSLGILDLKTLDELDSQTLGDIEFTEGVIANVVKNININILNVIEVQTVAYTLRYVTLGELDTQTLGDLDLLTLQQVEEQLT